MTDRILTSEDLAHRYGVPLKSVRKWRHEGPGPQGFRVGRHVRYREGDVRRWEEDRIRAERQR